MRKFFTHADPVLPMHHPRVLVETAIAQGADRAALLANTGITEPSLSSPDARISYVQFATLTYNALQLTGNTALGVDFGRQIHLAQMGVLGLALMSSRNVGAALEVGFRYHRSVAPAWDLRLTVESGRARIAAREAIPLSPFRVFATEALLAAMEAQAKQLLGRPLPLLALRLHFARPDHLERYAELPIPDISFDQPFTEVEFDAAYLDEPIAGADPATARLAEQYCASAAATAGAAPGLVAQIRGLLLGAPSAYPDLNSLAKGLQTSSRSLRRALRGMGTSYQELLVEARRERAIEWVTSTHLSAEEISVRLGFGDVRSFRRAFKRWTGRSPLAFRDAPDPP
jgi:AraC-like DNA-binding protein